MLRVRIKASEAQFLFDHWISFAENFLVDVSPSLLNSGPQSFFVEIILIGFTKNSTFLCGMFASLVRSGKYLWQR